MNKFTFQLKIKQRDSSECGAVKTIPYSEISEITQYPPNHKYQDCVKLKSGVEYQLFGDDLKDLLSGYDNYLQAIAPK